jgi:hypothetical protein
VPRFDSSASDPLAFDPRREDDFTQAAAFGLSHVLYAKSPGGVVASARRTARFRVLIESTVRGSGVDPDLLEAIVLLESAGRPDAIARGDPASASGLAQIVAETGINFLGMPIDLAVSRRLTRMIAAAEARGDRAAVNRLRERRQRADARFEPELALAGAVRYLTTARRRFGRPDLAVVSYHMGIGNLENVLRAYADAPAREPIASVVGSGDLSYARLYFDSSPLRHSAAWRRLNALGDSSRDYYWRVLAARQIMRLFREDRQRLADLALLHAAKASAEEVLHPQDETERFETPADVEEAWSGGELQRLPLDPRAHLSLHASMGRLAPLLDAEPELYRGLRAEALALLLYVAARVEAISGEKAPLVVTSTVRDAEYQRLLVAENDQATHRYSLHTTGYAFDIARRYGSEAQASAFQFMLERLAALGLIAWVREPAAIHVTVSLEAALLVPVMLRPAAPVERSATVPHTRESILIPRRGPAPRRGGLRGRPRVRSPADPGPGGPAQARGRSRVRGEPPPSRGGSPCFPQSRSTTR